MPNTEIINRIKRMELYYDTIFNAVHNAPELLKDEYVSKMLEELTDYYENGRWLKDFEADERGEIPKSLKRGMLTEDAIYDLLYDVKQAKKALIAPPDDIPVISFDRYIEIGNIKANDIDGEVKSVEITVGSAIFNKGVKRRSVISVLKEIKKICGSEKAELVFKMVEGGKWDALDWANSVYLIVVSLIEQEHFDSLVIHTNKTAFDLYLPDKSRFRSKNDRKMFDYLVKIADIVMEV